MDSTSDREHEKGSRNRPRGRRVVWVGRQPPVEGAPPALPGVVVDDLPDGWTFVSWLDKDGWYCPDAVYEVKNLQVVSEAEFDDAVRAVRGSPDWQGIVHDVVDGPEPSPYVVGASVMWIGPVLGDADWDPSLDVWRLAVFGSASGPARGHRGRIVEISQSGALRVRWIDRDGEFEARDFIDPGDVAVVGIASGG
ncbi:hypothetical protein ACIRON_00675 [Nocardioides sp. NPDC101246]|uniref:hypothetical protein n=1 Tax=Nocardioides sp. NPDC101246 TaxID=3364336 RepID=UPI00381109F9